MTVGQRVKKLRQALDLTQQEFADKLGVSRGNIGAYETGKSNIGPAAFSLICKTFNISEEWLRTGEGEMYAMRSREEELASAVNNLLSNEKPEFRRRLILALSGLTDSQWDYLETFLQGVLNEHNGNSVLALKTDVETPEEYERRVFQGMTRAEYHEELDRQLDEQEKEMASVSSPSGYGIASGGGKSA